MSQPNPFSIWSEINRDWPDISVIVLSGITPVDIRKQLDALLTQDYPAWQFEVLLINGGTFHDSDLLDVPVRIIQCQPCNKNEMLEIGLRAAQFPVVIVLDAGEIPVRNCLQEFARGFENDQVVLVMGRYLSRSQTGLAWCRQVEHDRNCKWMIRRSEIDPVNRYPAAFRKDFYFESISKHDGSFDLLGRQMLTAAWSRSLYVTFRYEANIEKPFEKSARDLCRNSFTRGRWRGDFYFAEKQRITPPGLNLTKPAILLPLLAASSILYVAHWGFGIIGIFLLFWLLSIADKAAEGLYYRSGPSYGLRLRYSFLSILSEVLGFYRSIWSEVVVKKVKRWFTAETSAYSYR